MDDRGALLARRSGPVAFALFLLIGSLVALGVWQSEHQRVALLRSQVRARGDAAAAALQQEIHWGLALGPVLAALLRQGLIALPEMAVPAAAWPADSDLADPDVADPDVADLVAELLSFFPKVSAIYLAPEGVIRVLYPPPTGPPHALGLDLFRAWPAAAAVRHTRAAGALALTLPAGSGDAAEPMIVTYWPVSLDRARAQPRTAGTFWGLLGVLMPVAAVMESAGLADLQAQGVDYRLWQPLPDGGTALLIAASSTRPLHAAIERPIELPNTLWTLSLAPARGWGAPARLATKAGLGFGLSLLPALLVWFWLRAYGRQLDLARTLAERSAEVQARAADLARAEAIARVGSWVYDITTDRASASAVAMRVTGIATAVLTYAQFRERVHPQDRARIDQAWQAALTGAPYDIEHRCLIDGELRWLRQRAQVEFGPNGEACTASGTVEDVTELRLAQDALRANEAWLRNLIETTTEGVWVLDPAGLTTFANARLAALLGCRREDLIGRPVFAFMDAEQRVAAERYLDRRAAGISETHEFRLRRQDGAELWVLISTNPLYDADRRYTGALAMLTDITARRAAQQEVEQLAFYDPLTGLPNRRLLLDRLRQALAAAGRSGRHGAVLFIDLDRFKAINDRLGHRVGDTLLQQIARRLRAVLREGDSVARLGGDEFVILLPDLGPAAERAAVLAERVARKLIEALAPPYRLEGQDYCCTLSIGIAEFGGVALHGSVDPEDLLQRADMAMYQAKAAGRNTLRRYDPRRQRRLVQHADLEADLRHAIATDALRLHYQPQVTATGHLSGVEALLRWPHPVHGATAPAQLVAAAEAAGLATDLGRWVLHQACAQLAAWASDPARALLTLAVNIGPVHFHQPGLVADVREALAATGAPPARLRLELAEPTLIADLDDSERKLAALKALGVGLTLDNFGKGLCSLVSLRRLPLDQVKLAPDFVRDFLAERADPPLTDPFIALASSLGLTLMAEGIETGPQRDDLLRHGCLVFQGFLFGRPGPVAALPAPGLGATDPMPTGTP